MRAGGYRNAQSNVGNESAQSKGAGYDDLESRLRNAGPAGLPYLETLGKLQTYQDNHAKALNEADVAQRNILGYAAQTALGAVKAGVDPNTVMQTLQSNLPKPVVDKIQADLKARGPQAFPQILQEYMQSSPEVSKELNAIKVAQTRAAGSGEKAEFTGPGQDGQPHRFLPTRQDDGTYKNVDLGPAEATGQSGVDSQELQSYLKNHPKSTPEDFAKWKASLGPTISFNLQAQGAAGAGSNPATAGKSGQDYLAALNPQRANLVKALDEGRIPTPNSFALKTPYWQSVMNDVTAYDPQFSTQRAEIRKAFTTGPDGKNIGALNTAAVHLDELSEAAKALDNGSFVPGNQVYNSIRTMFGSALPTNFEGIKSAVSGEMANALKGNATDQEISNIAKTINGAGSPAQLAGIVDTQLPLLRQKLGTYQQRYQQQIPNDTTWSPVLPQAQQVFAKHGIGGSNSSATISVKAPNGKTYNFPDQKSAADILQPAGGK